MTLPSTPQRDAARAAHERFFAAVLEADLDRCQLTYGRAVTVGGKTCQAALVDAGAVQGSTGTVTTLAATAPATTLVGTYLRMSEGPAAGEDRKITAYDTGTKAATHAAFTGGTPVNGNAYQVHDAEGAIVADRMCYNVFSGDSPCQDQPNYNRGVHTYRFCLRGQKIPPAAGVIRPYISRFSGAPAEIDPEEGVGRRALLSISMLDEPDSDLEQDPYFAFRQTPAGSTFARRLMARNPNVFGRFVRWRKGYVVSPWDWLTFLDELYVIERLSGPDERATWTWQLKDPIKLLDANKLPLPTDGKLVTELKAVEFSGAAVSATATTITLPAQASAVDDVYNGMEVHVTANTGVGQRRVISDYTGATRVATVPAWSVTPDSTSTLEIGALELVLDAGKGPDYDRYGTPGFVRLGDEVIKWTVRSGAKLTWPDTAHRAQAGTEKEDHRVDERVQMVKGFFDQKFSQVIEFIANDGGIADANIDLAGLVVEDDTWLGGNYKIDEVYLVEPAAHTEYLKELAVDSGGVIWWSPTDQKLRYKVIAPAVAAVPLWRDEGQLAQITVEREEALRITRAALNYALRSATANRREGKNYEFGAAAVDALAEDARDHGDVRPLVRYSRWFGRGNATAAQSYVFRTLNDRRDAPARLSLRLDPKDYTLGVGDLVDVQSSRLVDAAGAPKTTRTLVTRVDDRGAHIEIEGRSTLLGRRFAFIAPNGTADYPTEQLHAHVSEDTGLMSDGDPGYLIF